VVLKITKIYLDMNIYNRVFDDQTQLRIKFETMAVDIIFELIEKEKYKLCWSFILEDENNINPYIYRKNYIKTICNICKIKLMNPIDFIRQEMSIDVIE